MKSIMETLECKDKIEASLYFSVKMLSPLFLGMWGSDYPEPFTYSNFRFHKVARSVGRV